ncbi:MAG: hypothetical protein ACK4Z0_03515 [Sphingomonadaceae bacterium]
MLSLLLLSAAAASMPPAPPRPCAATANPALLAPLPPPQASAPCPVRAAEEAARREAGRPAFAPSPTPPRR